MSKWVKDHAINKGDEIELVSHGKSIMIMPKSFLKAIEEKSIRIETPDEQFIRHLLNNLYRVGFDKLNVKFDTIKQFEVIQELTNTHFLGFEVTKKEKNSCVVENITEPHEEKYEVLLRRIFLIIKESLQTIIYDLKNNKYELLSFLKQQYGKINQFSNFCMRCLAKNSSKSDSNIEYLFVYELLILEAELKHMYEFLDNNKDTKISKKTIMFVERMHELFDEFYNLFFKKDINKISSLNKELKNLLYKNAYSLLSSAKGKEAVVIYHLSAFTRFMILLISPTLGILESRK